MFQKILNKKIISLLLVLIMLMTVITGCKQSLDIDNKSGQNDTDIEKVLQEL